MDWKDLACTQMSSHLERSLHMWKLALFSFVFFLPTTSGSLQYSHSFPTMHILSACECLWNTLNKLNAIGNIQQEKGGSKCERLDILENILAFQDDVREETYDTASWQEWWTVSSW